MRIAISVRRRVRRSADRNLEPAPGAAMLDLGCGSGRHARSLAARGFAVTGIDLSAASLALARQQAGPAVRFIEQDMRVPFGRRAFDYVFSLFTSFGYFEDRGRSPDGDSQHRQIIEAPAARWCSTTSTSHHAENVWSPARSSIRGEARYHITRWSDSQALLQAHRHRGSQPGRAARARRASREVHARRLPAAVCCDGFTIDGVFGDYELGAVRTGIVAAADHRRP